MSTRRLAVLRSEAAQQPAGPPTAHVPVAGAVVAGAVASATGSRATGASARGTFSRGSATAARSVGASAMQRARPERLSPGRARPERRRPQRARPERPRPGPARPGRPPPGPARPERRPPGHARPGRPPPQHARPERPRRQRARPERSAVVRVRGRACRRNRRRRPPRHQRHLLNDARAREVAPHRERRQGNDHHAQTVEVARPTRASAGCGRPSGRRSRRSCDARAGSRPEPIANHAPAASATHPAVRPPTRVEARHQHQAADHRHRAREGCSSHKPLRREMPGLVAAEGVVEVGPDERDEAAPDPEEHDQ